MKEENYRPNAIARSLSNCESNSIGIFFTDHLNSGLSHSFFREVIYGLENKFSKKGYDLIIFANQWEEQYSYTDKCKNRQVDGAILMGMPRSNPYLDSLVNSDIPAVFIDLDIVGKNATYVVSNNIEGARTAINYLFSLGHRKIGMIMGQTITKPAQDRLIGFQQAVDQLGIPYNQLSNRF